MISSYRNPMKMSCSYVDFSREGWCDTKYILFNTFTDEMKSRCQSTLNHFNE